MKLYIEEGVDLLFVGEELVKFIGPELVQQAKEKLHVIRTHLKAAQDRQKKQADVRRRELEFQVGLFS
jgi:hypothetical protein